MTPPCRHLGGADRGPAPCQQEPGGPGTLVECRPRLPPDQGLCIHQPVIPSIVTAAG